ncbi:hypothetical protein DI09_121p20 [Mitosporidium daphniae]|uniref:U3 small nucleolar RNA-associated protein 15 C-terminal domain-containing protein n=1 Tax=Mitosporidium daphniae TaxID=1485682 RepID=A0A098VV25_9MICR|nr:uncharacterized protein DI09_121p20 [Mitosporidium daphniae]KGG52943.1 hypothetical protein DI09_121p20 [Mitosporidium daphniae]|eukprot:XP_013239379.1 uncharacterized protein DI09_121p20 [Mitosporidium daphniae]
MLYWNTFKVTHRVETGSPAMEVLFTPLTETLTWATGSTISICSGSSTEVQKRLTRCKEDITCIAYRSDGRLLLSGCVSGLMQLHDVKSRSIMRTLSGHTRAVTAISFLGNSGRAISASEDMTVGLWDILGEKMLSRFEGHTDYVKSLAFSLDSNPDVFYSGLGSYDKSIRCWDLRTGETLAAFQHEEPVESMVIGSGSILYSAAGSKIYGWDLVSSTASKSPLFSYTPHQKTITALVYDRKTMSILTGSIDHHVKVIGIDPATGELRTERTFVYGSPILCVVLNDGGNRLAVGMASGQISIRERKESPPIAKTATKSTSRIVVEKASLPKYREIDSLLRSFDHRRALDVAIASPSASVLALLFEEFARRGVLLAVFSGRSLEYLKRLSLVLLQYSTDPHHAPIMIRSLQVLVDFLESFSIKNPVERQSILDLLSKFRVRIQNELALQEEVSAVSGVLELLLANTTSG